MMDWFRAALSQVISDIQCFVLCASGELSENGRNVPEHAQKETVMAPLSGNGPG